MTVIALSLGLTACQTTTPRPAPIVYVAKVCPTGDLTCQRTEWTRQSQIEKANKLGLTLKGLEEYEDKMDSKHIADEDDEDDE